MEERNYKIGEVSKETGSTIAAIRHYQKVGLISPSEVDEFTGYRYFTYEDLIKIKTINHLRRLNISLEDIGNILKQPIEEIEVILNKNILSLEEEIRKLEDIKFEVMNLKKIYRDQIDFNYNREGLIEMEDMDIILEEDEFLNAKVLNRITDKYGTDVREVGMLVNQGRARVFVNLYSGKCNSKLEGGTYEIHQVLRENLDEFLKEYETAFVFVRFISALNWNYELRIKI